MLTDKTYLGILRTAINVQTGEPHTDWRLSHVGQKGLIVAQPAEEKAGKYVLYLFMPTLGTIGMQCCAIQIMENGTALLWKLIEAKSVWMERAK